MTDYREAYRLMRQRVQNARDRIEAARLRIESNTALSPETRLAMTSEYTGTLHELDIILQAFDTHDPEHPQNQTA